MFDWDDGNESSLVTSCAGHAWDETDDYSVTVRARCSHGVESPWSEECTVKIDDIYEDNDSRSTASDINGHENETIRQLRAFDDDYYTIYLVTGEGRIRVWCNFTHDQGDIDIYLLNSDGSTVAQSSGVVDNEYINYDAPLCALRCHYFIKVVSYGSDHGNWYTLRYETVTKEEMAQ